MSLEGCAASTLLVVQGSEADARPSIDDEGNESSRPLGLIVARGTLLVLISPLDGSEPIENPFNVAEEE